MKSMESDIEMEMMSLKANMLVLRLLHTTCEAENADPTILEMARAIYVETMDGIVSDFCFNVESLYAKSLSLEKQLCSQIEEDK